MKAGWLVGVWVGVAAVGCTPGYMKSSELERKGQGPAACRNACQDMGMRMTAMVLVGDQVPGCVCQPLFRKAEPASGPAAAPVTTDDDAEPGAAASTGGFVVIAAAAAARQQQLQQQQRSQSVKH